MERIAARGWFAAAGNVRAQQAIDDAEKRSGTYTEEVEHRQCHAIDVNLPGGAHS